jgi:large subunit ribosomal protein L29
MEMDKILNLDKEELALQAHQAAEQIFRLRFQLRMGQNEGVKKLRELKKDVARIKTAERQRELGIAAPSGEAKPKRAKKTTKTKTAKAKSVKAKKSTAKSSKKISKAGGKAKSAGRTNMKSAKRGKANAKKGGS